MAARKLVKLFKSGQAVLSALWKDGHSIPKKCITFSKVYPSVKPTPILSHVKTLNYWAFSRNHTLAAKLRRSAAENFAGFNRCYQGNTSALQRRLALFGFVAVGLTSNNGSQDGGYDLLDEEKSDVVVEKSCDYILRKTQEWAKKKVVQPKSDEFGVNKVSDLEFGQLMDKGCNAAVYSAAVSRPAAEPEQREHESTSDESTSDDDLAIKVMFNYDVESNNCTIQKAMKKEMVPLKNKKLICETGLAVLPEHPNIVDMKAAFVDETPELDQCKEQFPMALPPRLYTEGLGRNKTLFIVMKKYSYNLDQFLKHIQCPSSKLENLHLLVQLLEGVFHLSNHNIAHRDLKSNNLLVEVREPGDVQLVLSDFGCCVSPLQLYYCTEETDKGGNTALMAPEIWCAKPGWFRYLNYSKADLWACGAIAYELFGCENPFYRKVGLNPATYTESQLPLLPERLGIGINVLVRLLLNRDPCKRPSAEEAANWAQLLLWAPEGWFGSSPPHNTTIIEWILRCTTRALSDENYTSQRKLWLLYLSRLSSIAQIQKDVSMLRRLITLYAMKHGM